MIDRKLSGAAALIFFPAVALLRPGGGAFERVAIALRLAPGAPNRPPTAPSPSMLGIPGPGIPIPQRVPDDPLPGGRLPDEPGEDPTGPLPSDIEQEPSIDEPTDLPAPPPNRLPGAGNPAVHLVGAP